MSLCSNLTQKLLFAYGFSSKDLCASVNDNTNSAILEGKYIVGNNKTGKCEMCKAELILKHATGLATQKKKGQVVDSNPTFVKIYKTFYNFAAWLMSSMKCQQFVKLSKWAESQYKVIVEIPLPNTTHVAGCLTLFQYLI